MIKVKYQVLEPILDFTKSMDNSILIHPEESFVAKEGKGTDPARNLCASQSRGEGDVDEVLSRCDYVVEEVYHTKAVNQAMMEPFNAFAQKDIYGRLKITSSTQIPFHVRRIVARALNISKSNVRVVKPRIGGGFGAKQTAVCEVYPLLSLIRPGNRPRSCTQERRASSAVLRVMRCRCPCGLARTKKGRSVPSTCTPCPTRARTGARADHSGSVRYQVHLSVPGSGRLPVQLRCGLYKCDVRRRIPGIRRDPGIFAVESAVNELAHKMGMDPAVLREKNIVHEGDRLMNYYGQTTDSCALDRCIRKVKEMIDWDKKYPYVKTGRTPSGRWEWPCPCRVPASTTVMWDQCSLS